MVTYNATRATTPYLSMIARYQYQILLSPILDSKWSRWSSWSDCTKTCGTGARHRTRTCLIQNPAEDDVFAPITCAGNHIQKKTCAEWSCPGSVENFLLSHFHFTYFERRWQNVEGRLYSFNIEWYQQKTRLQQITKTRLVRCSSQGIHRVRTYMWVIDQVRSRWLDIGQVLFLRVYGPRRSQDP